MAIRDLVGWTAWGCEGADGAATRVGGDALVGRRILGHEGDLEGGVLLTTVVVRVTLGSGRWVVTTTSGSRYRLGAALERTVSEASPHALAA